ncbi:MAG: TerC family protein [Alphaproteobacteria bacterium]|nr:TerC family protein [Alphaproteobacteria bacterium]|tara:strand:- start:948 stop:1679 length:732 start_codon:yes stop_codon:yes gene_type:complete
MFELLTDPTAWASFLTLSLLEIVLGVDNVIFLSIITSRLPAHQQPMARRIGLILALIGRVVLLFALSWIISLSEPLFEIIEIKISYRDLILASGGLFLIYKSICEIHKMIDGNKNDPGKPGAAIFLSVLIQIFLLDLVFSLDSVLTAIGMTEHIVIMIAAILVAICVMLVAAETISSFVLKRPTIKMLALSFLLLIGITLIADSIDLHIPRGLIYFGIAFATFVELLNLLARNKKTKKTLDLK